MNIKIKRHGRRRRPSGTLPSIPAREVYSYHETRFKRENTTGRKQATQDRKGFRRFTAILMALSSIVLLGYVLTLSGNPQIIAGGPPKDQIFLRAFKSYQTEADKLFNDSILDKFKLTINTRGIEKQMQDKFPELQDVSVILPLAGRRPVLELTAGRPKLVLRTKDQSFIVDSRGIATMDPADLSSPAQTNLVTVDDISSVELSEGTNVLTSQEVNFISVVHYLLSARGIKIKAVTLPAVPNEVRFSFSGQSYYSKFDMTTDAKQAAGAFLAVSSYLKKTGQNPASYIDVRIPERVYYK